MKKLFRILLVVLIAILIIAGVLFGLWAWSWRELYTADFTLGKITGHPSTDDSFLTGISCQAPCWYGIELGESTLADVLETIDTLPFVENISQKEYENEFQITFDCPYILDSSCGVITTENNIVTRISYQNGFELSFREAVNVLEDPDQIWAWLDHGSCYILLDWGPSKAIGLEFYQKSNISECTTLFQTGKLSSALEVNRIIYATSPYCEIDNNSCFEWKGFGDN